MVYWASKGRRYSDWEVIQVHCRHWKRKGWKKDFCMPKNSLNDPTWVRTGAHTCRMYEEETKHYSVISGSTKRTIRIVCQKCQKESKISKQYEGYLIAKFTAQITLAEGYELIPEFTGELDTEGNIKYIKPQNYNKAIEKLLECENWIQIFQISASEVEELQKQVYDQDIAELQSWLKIKCSYGLVKCYLFGYLVTKKSFLWLNGKKHLDYLVSTLPDRESVREIEQFYIHNSPEVLATMTEKGWYKHITQGFDPHKLTKRGTNTTFTIEPDANTDGAWDNAKKLLGPEIKNAVWVWKGYGENDQWEYGVSRQLSSAVFRSHKRLWCDL